ncbi:MAG: hypothetical protein QXG98_05380 [Candidatus Micrarchaeia archaeon]
MNSHFLAALGLVLLALGIALTLMLSQTAERWAVDATKSLFNPGGIASAQLHAGALARVERVAGKNVLLPKHTSGEDYANMVKDAHFQNALASAEPVVLYSGPYGRAVVTSYAGDRLAALASDPLIRGALEGRVADVAGATAAGPGDAKLLYVQSAGGMQIPLLALPELSEGTLAHMVGTKEFQHALIESQRAQGRRLLLYQDLMSSHRIILPRGFSASELRALQTSTAVKQALALQPALPGQLIDVAATPAWSGLDVSTLPARPQASLALPFNPLANLVLPANAWLIPAVALAVLGLVYFLGSRLARPAQPYARARGRWGAHITELEVARGVGLSRRKAWGEDERIIRLEPVFRIKIIDNVLAEEGRVTIAIANESGKRIEKLSLFSGAEETLVGTLEPGEEKNVSFAPQLEKGTNIARIFLRFSPLVVEGRAYARFEFNLPVERL